MVIKGINYFLVEAEREVNSTLKMKFTLLIGDTFTYRLPIASEETTFELIYGNNFFISLRFFVTFFKQNLYLGPFGTIFNEDRGIIEWKAVSNLVTNINNGLSKVNSCNFN